MKRGIEQLADGGLLLVLERPQHIRSPALEPDRELVWTTSAGRIEAYIAWFGLVGSKERA